VVKLWFRTTVRNCTYYGMYVLCKSTYPRQLASWELFRNGLHSNAYNLFEQRKLLCLAIMAALGEREKLINDYRNKINEHMEVEAT
jgi:hypothetical protein